MLRDEDLDEAVDAARDLGMAILADGDTAEEEFMGLALYVFPEFSRDAGGRDTI